MSIQRIESGSTNGFQVRGRAAPRRADKVLRGKEIRGIRKALAEPRAAEIVLRGGPRTPTSAGVGRRHQDSSATRLGSSAYARYTMFRTRLIFRFVAPGAKAASYCTTTRPKSTACPRHSGSRWTTRKRRTGVRYASRRAKH